MISPAVNVIFQSCVSASTSTGKSVNAIVAVPKLIGISPKITMSASPTAVIAILFDLFIFPRLGSQSDTHQDTILLSYGSSRDAAVLIIVPKFCPIFNRMNALARILLRTRA